jgi:predicted RNase H-like nuclease
MSPQRGPELPYTVVAAVTPYGGGWLVASAKMHAATFAPEQPRGYSTFLEVLEERPAFSVIVVNAPIGYMDSPSDGPRVCDTEARRLLGRRGTAVQNAPTRLDLNSPELCPQSRLGAVSRVLLPRYREVALEMASYRQRVVYEGHPELSFYQLNENRPLLWSKRREEGRQERRSLLEKKVSGANKIIDADIKGAPEKHLLDLAALLWSSRRILGRAAVRIPREGEWDSEGLREELVY